MFPWRCAYLRALRLLMFIRFSAFLQWINVLTGGTEYAEVVVVVWCR